MYNFFIRTIENSIAGRFPNKSNFLYERGPFILEDELYLFKKHSIKLLVSKNSGGEHTYPKIEASRKLNIPVIGLADSNVNPDYVDIVIPGNDDAIRSIELIASSIADSCLKGLGKRKEVTEKKDTE